MFSLIRLDQLKDKLPPRALQAYQKLSLGGKRVTVGYGLALLLLGAISVASYKNATELAGIAVSIGQTQTAIRTLSDLDATLTEADNGRRGYYLYQDDEELAIYQTAVAAVDPLVAQLQTLHVSPNQRQRLNELERLIRQRLALSEQAIAQFQRQRISTVQDSFNIQLQQNQRQIRQITTDLSTELELALQNQLKKSQADSQSRLRIETLGTLLIFVILLGVYLLLYRQKTKRQRAEYRQRILAQSNELSDLKLQFFSMISHEFRTPLSLILGSAQLLEENIRSVVKPEKLKSLYRIQTSAKRMTQLLSDLLTISRADAGELEFNPTFIEMQTFCLNLVEEFQGLTERQQTLHFVKFGNATHAQIDQWLVYSVLSNLLTNALKYSPAQSQIDFTLICEPDQVMFRIQDRGIGISPEDQKWLYEPFSRGTNVAGITGTGLGLALVKKCLDLHQGSITLESQVGVGSTFTVSIPQTGNHSSNSSPTTHGSRVP